MTNVFRKSSTGWKLTRHHASDRDVPAKGSAGGSAVTSLVGSGGSKQQQPGGSDGQGGLLSHFVDENGQVTELSARMFRVADGEIRYAEILERHRRSFFVADREENACTVINSSGWRFFGLLFQKLDVPGMIFRG